MTPEDLQKFRILSNSNDEFVSAASARLLEEASDNGHQMMNFVIEEGHLLSPRIKYTILQSCCVLCLFEIEIQFGKNGNGDFADIQITGDEVCVGEDI